MVTMDDKAAIRHAVLVEGKSQRQVARETGFSRNTVRKLVANSDVPKYTLRQARPSPVLGPYQELLSQWVAEDEKRPKKKRRTTVRMFALLKERYGYQGAESTLRWYVGQLRRKARQKVYIPLAYAPGETAQVDFGEADVMIAGEEVTAQIFLMWLGRCRWRRGSCLHPSLSGRHPGGLLHRPCGRLRLFRRRQSRNLV